MALPRPLDDREFARRVLITLLLVGLALLAYRLAGVLLLIFGAALIAVIIRAIADPLTQRLRLPNALGLLLSVLVLFGIIAAAMWLMGSEVAAQIGQIRSSLPAAWDSLEARIRDTAFGDQLIEALQEAIPSGSSVATSLGGYAMSFGNALADLVLVVIAGLFLAAEPRLYRRGLLKLLPNGRRERLGRALDNSGRALRLWLLGQLIAMLLVGVLTWLGLTLIGVPAALTLGLFAGLAEFVPFLGPIVAAIPGVLLALLASPTTALWAAAVYLAVQQVEGNLVTPLVARQTVSLPPVVTLFGLLALGVIFGFLGLLLAAPLTVVIYVMVKQLYVRETLGTNTDVPGEKEDDGNRSEADAVP